MRSRRGGSRRRKRPRTGAPLTSTVNSPPGSGSSRAYSPIQRTKASGRVKYSQTRSGGASMWTVALTRSAQTGSVVIAGLHRPLELLELLRPELREEIPQPGQALGTHDVQPPLALRAHRHQARVLEHLQMLRHGLLGDVELLGDLVDRTRPAAQQPQDASPMRLGEGPERGFAHAAHDTKNKSLYL